MLGDPFKLACCFKQDSMHKLPRAPHLRPGRGNYPEVSSAIDLRFNSDIAFAALLFSVSAAHHAGIIS